MPTHIEAHLRFHSKTALTRGQKAFKEHAPEEVMTWNDLQVRDLVVSLHRSLEVEADVALWSAFQALAAEAKEGFVVFDEGTGGVGALHVLLSQGEGHRQRWVEHACTPKTPLGIAVEVAQRFDIWVHQAPRWMDAIKALRAALKMEISEAKACACGATCGRGRGEGGVCGVGGGGDSGGAGGFGVAEGANPSREMA